MSKIDWTIHAVPDVYDDNPLTKGMMNLHTHGLVKYGLTELSAITVPDVYSPERVAKILNTIGRMMVNGETFNTDFKYIHCVDNADGTTDFKFRFLPTTCFGEKTLRIILPDVNGKFFNGTTNLNPCQFELLHTTLFEMEEVKCQD